MKKFVALFIAALFVTTSAFAYDSLISNDTSAVQEAGTMQAGIELNYLTSDTGWDKDGDDYDLADDNTNMLLPVKFRYGVMEGLEAFGVLNVFQSWDNGATDDAGIGDLWLGAKYGVMPDGLFTVRGALDIPLGDDEKGLGYAGGFGIDVAGLTTYKMMDEALTLDGQLGVRWNAEDGDTKIQPGFGFYLDGEASYAFTEMVAGQIGFQFMNHGDNKFDGDDMDDTAGSNFELNLGACAALAENMKLKGDILFDLFGSNYNKDMGLALAFQYGF